jgi:hypothetical protein
MRDKNTNVKTLDDVKADMSELYSEVRDGTIELKVASELANITGKFLKAEQLKLAREIFASARGSRLIEVQDAEAVR